MANKYARSGSKAIRKNPVSFEMIEERLKAIKPGRKITIWIELAKGNDGKERTRIVKGTIIAVYRTMIHVKVKIRSDKYYNECFSKFELYNSRFEVR